MVVALVLVVEVVVCLLFMLNLHIFEFV